MKLTEYEILHVSIQIPNSIYYEKITETRQLCDLISKLKPDVSEPNDYVTAYEDNFYTYKTWEDLLKSEREQGDYGLTAEQCQEEFNHSIWMLPCGWFVQKV